MNLIKVLSRDIISNLEVLEGEEFLTLANIYKYKLKSGDFKLTLEVQNGVVKDSIVKLIHGDLIINDELIMSNVNKIFYHYSDEIFYIVILSDENVYRLKYGIFDKFTPDYQIDLLSENVIGVLSSSLFYSLLKEDEIIVLDPDLEIIIKLKLYSKIKTVMDNFAVNEKGQLIISASHTEKSLVRHLGFLKLLDYRNVIEVMHFSDSSVYITDESLIIVFDGVNLDDDCNEIFYTEDKKLEGSFKREQIKSVTTTNENDIEENFIIVTNNNEFNLVTLNNIELTFFDSMFYNGINNVVLPSKIIKVEHTVLFNFDKDIIIILLEDGDVYTYISHKMKFKLNKIDLPFKVIDVLHYENIYLLSAEGNLYFHPDQPEMKFENMTIIDISDKIIKIAIGFHDIVSLLTDKNELLLATPYYLEYDIIYHNVDIELKIYKFYLKVLNIENEYIYSYKYCNECVPKIRKDPKENFWNRKNRPYGIALTRK